MIVYRKRKPKHVPAAKTGILTPLGAESFAFRFGLADPANYFSPGAAVLRRNTCIKEVVCTYK
jgi:hypothetical protein